jgi:hypothetical protein
MRVILESTTKLVEVDGEMYRIWEGHTEIGKRGRVA